MCSACGKGKGDKLIIGLSTYSDKVQSSYRLYYIKTGEFDIKIGKTIGRLMKMKEEADYSRYLLPKKRHL